MTLISASEDLWQRTLEQLPSEFSRLSFLASLKTREGYEHWGLGRKYGQEVASDVIAGAHTETFVRVLEMTIAQAALDLNRAAADEQMSDAEYLRRVAPEAASLLPYNAGGGSAKQLAWMLFVLTRLLVAAEAQTGRAA